MLVVLRVVVLVVVVVVVKLSLTFTPPTMAGQLQWWITFDQCIEMAFPIQTRTEVRTPANVGRTRWQNIVRI